MEIILTEDVVGVGDIGERIRVKGGFARNYLIPRGLAFEAQSASAKQLAHQVRLIETKKRKLKGSAEEAASDIRNLTLQFELRVGSSGKVFGSVSNRDIADKLATLGYKLDRRRVVVDEPIKKLGTHFARVKLHAEVETQVKVEVLAIAASDEDEQRAIDQARDSLEHAAELRDAQGTDASDLSEIEADEDAGDFE